jgi:hypothetical protein
MAVTFVFGKQLTVRVQPDQAILPLRGQFSANNNRYLVDCLMDKLAPHTWNCRKPRQQEWV